MSAALTRWFDSRVTPLVGTGLVLLYIALDYWREGAVITRVAQYAFLSYVSLQFGVKFRAGYLRRKPHWTRESWRRYVRLAAMPVMALILVLWLSSGYPSWIVLGAPRSALRSVWIVIVFALMILGVAGFIRAEDWLTRGEASEQFTRTRWFQRRA